MDKKLRKTIQERIKQYYKDLRIIEILDHESKILLENKKNLQKIIFDYKKVNTKEYDEAVKMVEAKVHKKSKKIIKRQIKIADIIEKDAGISYILSKLNDEECEILKLKYEKNANFNEIADKFYMSKATISRKLNSITQMIAKYIEGKTK